MSEHEQQPAGPPPEHQVSSPDAPNESAPGHEIPDPPDEHKPSERTDPDAPNESAPGHNPKEGE